jgi:hypothetical protein
MGIVADRSWMNQGKPERSLKRRRSRPALSARGPEVWFWDVCGGGSGRVTRHSENALADTALLDLCTDRRRSWHDR